MTAQMQPTTVLLVTLQQGLQHARKDYKQRRACNDPRSSVGWSTEKEEAWKQVLESTRSGLVYWVGASNLLESSSSVNDS
jgi:hypothetical protein